MEWHILHEYILFCSIPLRISVIVDLLCHENFSKNTFFSWGPYLVDPIKRRAFNVDIVELINLTEKESEILSYFNSHPHESITRENLLQNIWHFADGINTHTLETHIYKLRQKFPACIQLLSTTDKGYQFISK